MSTGNHTNKCDGTETNTSSITNHERNLENGNKNNVSNGETSGDKSGCITRRNITPVMTWNKTVPNTELEKFKRVIEEKYKRRFDSYWDLHKWSIDHFTDFWGDVWNYFEIITSRPYDEVYRKTGNGFLDCEWFPGARFNMAENILRIRDDKLALIYADEGGNEEYITFSEMFEEVRVYAAAFRKHGLKKGDRVACYISNRKEAVFAYLATISIGAMFGGSLPYLGGKTATSIIKKMEPKFLITVDVHYDDGVGYYNIDYILDIADQVPCLEKVIIIATKLETKLRDFSNVKNSCLLEEFLKSAVEPDGTIPDLVFEQLPFDHPICINFTSGTSGLSKGPVHSAGTIISQLITLIFHCDLKCGDILYSCSPCGWTVWDSFLPCLACGVTLFLFAGNPGHLIQGMNMWDIFAKYKVTYTFLVSAIVENLVKMNVVPGPNSNLDNLRCFCIGGSPVLPHHYLYVHDKVKKDVFVNSLYGATEAFGTFSGFDMNLPCYAGEIQAPALGMDVQCFDQKGNSVVNQRGEMVLATPSPSLPLYMWKDDDNSIIKKTYFSKYPGVWSQNDEIFINSNTRGIVIIGRSDDTLIQNGDRFGPGDIYFAIHDVDEIQDSICVAQTMKDGDCRAVLFVKMKKGHQITAEFEQNLKRKISEVLWFDCVPKMILEVKDIPYNMNNKKMESIVRKIVSTNHIPEVGNIRNPECLKYFLNVPQSSE